jgi:hypothetical protein
LTNIIVQDENIELIKKFNQKLNFIQKNSKNPLYKFYFGEKNTYFIPDKIDNKITASILQSRSN